MLEVRKINDRISYIKASMEPLSSDVILIEGEEYTYLFDVGKEENRNFTFSSGSHGKHRQHFV